jgi:hypothetical protein
MGTAMIQSPSRDRRAKAIAEALAMIAYAQHPTAPLRPFAIRETDEWLSEETTSAALAARPYHNEWVAPSTIAAADRASLVKA